MKKIVIAAIILVCVVAGVVIAKNVILKRAIETFVSASTGLEIDMGRLDVSLSGTSVSVNDMIIFNPEGFSDKIMLYLPEVYIDYDIASIFKKEVHIYNMRIYLKEFTVVKRADARTNIDYLKGLKRKKEGRALESEKEASAGSRLQIDNLSLKIGRIIYKDYSGGGPPDVSRYNLNIDGRYKNVENIDQIVKIITLRAILNTAIGKLLDVREYKEIPSETLKGGKRIIKKTVDGLTDILKMPLKEKKQDGQ